VLCNKNCFYYVGSSEIAFYEVQVALEVAFTACDMPGDKSTCSDDLPDF
jgi:hypothetical protein